MSNRFVELQIAIPRAQEASIVQSQLQQKPVTEQALLAQQAVKRAETMRRKSQKVEEPDVVAIREDNDGRNRKGLGARKRKMAQKSGDQGEMQRQQHHPFKGQHIDMKL